MKLPELMISHCPTPSVKPLVSYRSGKPKLCPVSWATVPIGMICEDVHEFRPPSPLCRM